MRFAEQLYRRELSRGASLPDHVRSPFEERLGRGLGDVRVHDGPEAARAASGLQSRAFTTGRDIVFGAGE